MVMVNNWESYNQILVDLGKGTIYCWTIAKKYVSNNVLELPQVQDHTGNIHR